MKLHVGTSGYSYKEWQGIFYPEKISPKEMLRFYGEKLNAVEINYTFHHMPTERIIVPWGEQVPDDFRFVFKAPQIMTHVKRLKEVNEAAEYFFRTVALMKEKLGAVLFQFPPFFTANLPRLEAFLDLIPAGIRCAFEFRSDTWQESDVARLLASRGQALCTADMDEHPASEIFGNASWGYLRLRQSSYTDSSLTQWGERIRERQWEYAFVFFKHEEAALGPKLALRFRELAGAAGAAAR